MLDQVRQTIKRYHLLVPGDKVVVGVSGGPDSLALLHSLRMLQEDCGYTLHVAHLNHGLRPEAAADAAYVRQLAGEWGLPVTTASRDVARYQREHRLSLEEAAREVRYHFLEEVAARVAAGKIAVGHHADDQAETVLLNLLRGSGLTGLKAMLPQRGQLIRPLLFITRTEIEAYCRRHDLQPRQDRTNLDTTLSRNKIRHQLLPFLAREFNPAITRTLSRTAIILQEEEEILTGLAAGALARIKIHQDAVSLSFDRRQWLALAAGMQRRVLRLAAFSLGRKVNFDQVERARAVAARGGSITWPGHLRLAAGAGAIRLQVPADRPAAGSFCCLLRVPGLTPLPGLDRAIRAELRQPPAAFQGDENEAWLDWHKMEGPLAVRSWQAGDYFQPLGMAGRKKIQDYFSDIHLPRQRRYRVPLVVNRGHIVWVAGFRIAEDFKITPATRTALHLQLQPWP
jgi:tRNA(Ile)-lysidine synthase